MITDVILLTHRNETTKQRPEIEMKASKANQIINNNLKGVFMVNVIKAKGWTELQARSYLVEFVTSGAKLSLREFMEQK